MTQRFLAALVFVLAGMQTVAAQGVGAKAGNSYVPTTHSSACGGLLCDGVDPARLPDGSPAPAPPPCKQIICGDVPLTASDVKRIQEERARAAAAAPAPEPAAEPKPRRKKVVRVKKKAPVVATRTPAPPAAPAAQ